MNLLIVPWYLIFLGLAGLTAAVAYGLLMLSLRNARSSRTRSIGAAAPSFVAEDVEGESRALSRDSSDYVILGNAGADLADPHQACGLYETPAGHSHD